MMEIRNPLDDIKLIDCISGKNAIDRIMRRYALGSGDYENSKYVREKKQELGWTNYSKDIITPFWKTFCAALVYTSAHYEIVWGKWKSDNVKETYILVENNIWYRTYYDKRDNTMGTPLSKEKMGKRYLNGNFTYKSFIDKTIEIFPELEELAAISDSISNFSPCPVQPFNSMKGLLPDVCDFLNLFVDKIQKCVDTNVGLEYDKLSVTADDIRAWHIWLLENREKFLLQDYYVIDDNRLRGKEFFLGQSLNNPLPFAERDIRKCIENGIDILKKRGVML